jgi:hypothetical protein
MRFGCWGVRAYYRLCGCGKEGEGGEDCCVTEDWDGRCLFLQGE